MMKLTRSHYIYLSIMTLLTFILALLGDAGRDLFRYAPDLISHGEVWRMFTGHYVHLSWPHWLSNIAALWVIVLLWGSQFTARTWWLSTFVYAAAVSGVFIVFEPGLRGYVGLSGVLHGFILLGVLIEAIYIRRFAWLVALGVAVKIGYEQVQGAMPGSEEMIGGPVMVDAHFYGALIGVLHVILLVWLWRKGRVPALLKPAGAK